MRARPAGGERRNAKATSNHLRIVAADGSGGCGCPDAQPARSSQRNPRRGQCPGRDDSQRHSHAEAQHPGLTRARGDRSAGDRDGDRPEPYRGGHGRDQGRAHWHGWPGASDDPRRGRPREGAGLRVDPGSGGQAGIDAARQRRCAAEDRGCGVERPDDASDVTLLAARDGYALGAEDGRAHDEARREELGFAN